MSDLRTAAQRLLEAWDTTPLFKAGDGMLQEHFEVLRAALEQQKPPPEAQALAAQIAYCAGWWAAMEQKREQPAQEPVAPFDARLRAWRG
jgi:hypothetical protein